jgi:hemoglobin
VRSVPSEPDDSPQTQPPVGRRVPVRAVDREAPPELDPARVGGMYERVGGDAWFVALVDCFYDAVEHDPVLRPLYPPDLTAPKAHLTGFLVQYWGGPMTYSEQRGHPRLRMRHARFAIGLSERDAWYRAMADAVRAAQLPPEDEASFLAYFDLAATSLINQVA